MQPAPNQPKADQADAFDELMRGRRSVRGFLDRPVPDDLLRHIFSTAQLAPSNCNVQPWVVHVVSGGSAGRMRTLLHDHAASGAEPEPDFPMMMDAYPGEYRVRQIDAAKALFAATGVARGDSAARTESFLRNFRFFDAPHAAFLFIPKWAGMREAADCGMYAQSLMLTLVANGLASCAQGALGHHPALVRQALGVSDDMLLLFGFAFGYEDVSHPANATRTVRAALDEATIFHD